MGREAKGITNACFFVGFIFNLTRECGKQLDRQLDKSFTSSSIFQFQPDFLLDE
jgi:hypothetical protein